MNYWNIASIKSYRRYCFLYELVFIDNLNNVSINWYRQYCFLYELVVIDNFQYKKMSLLKIANRSHVNHFLPLKVHVGSVMVFQTWLNRVLKALGIIVLYLQNWKYPTRWYIIQHVLDGSIDMNNELKWWRISMIQSFKTALLWLFSHEVDASWKLFCWFSTVSFPKLVLQQ